MSNLKCPFCQQEIIIPKDDFCFGQQRCVCRNPNCEFDGWHFPVKLVSELIRTRKALEIAVNALKIAKDCCSDYSIECLAHKTLEQITALEQKNHFANASKKVEQKDVK